MIQRGIETAAWQVVPRESPGATPLGVATQLTWMYIRALEHAESTALVIDWPDPGRGAGGGPAAYTLLMPEPNPFTGERELVVLDIWTNPALRGRGIGQRILDGAEAYGGTIGCQSMVAQIALQNQPSLNLFRKSGFQTERVVVGRRFGPKR